jgi:hypothetical protein
MRLTGSTALWCLTWNDIQLPQLGVREFRSVKDHYRRYVRSGDVVRRIYVQPIDEKTARRVTGYGFKALEWRIPDTDRLLILPKALSELSTKERRVG